MVTLRRAIGLSIFAIMLVITIASAVWGAIPTANVVMALELNGDLTDETGHINCSGYNSPTHNASITSPTNMGTGYEFIGYPTNNESIYCNDLSSYVANDATIVMWYRVNKYLPTSGETSGNLNFGASTQANHMPYVNGDYYIDTFRTAYVNVPKGANHTNSTSWTMFTVTTEGGGYWKTYENGQQTGQAVAEASVTFSSNTTFPADPVYMGEKQYMSGAVTAFYLFNTTLDASQINELYNSGDGIEYPFASISQGNFTIEAYENASQDQILEFNATIHNITQNNETPDVYYNNTGYPTYVFNDASLLEDGDASTYTNKSGTVAILMENWTLPENTTTAYYTLVSGNETHKYNDTYGTPTACLTNPVQIQVQSSSGHWAIVHCYNGSAYIGVGSRAIAPSAITRFYETNMTWHKHTNYTTTNGVINETFATNTTHDTLIWTNNFINQTHKNYNTTNNLKANLTQKAMESINFTLTNPSPHQTGYNYTLSCEYTNPTDLNTTAYYHILNTQHGTTHNFTDTNYTIPKDYFADQLEFWCSVNTTYRTDNSSNNGTTANNTIDTLLTIQSLDSWYNLINSTNYLFYSTGNNYTSNPLYILATEFLNMTHKVSTEITRIIDNSGFHRTINHTINLTENTTQYNLSLPPSMLILNFSTSTTGIIQDLDRRTNFTNQTFIIIQQNLSAGYVGIYFNNVTNWTQFYEYDNTETTHINENITILGSSANWYTYIEVQDYASSPIEDAIVRIEYSTYDTAFPTWSNHTLIGQRLTNSEGVTYFWITQGATQKLTISKAGYDTVTLLLLAGDRSFTESSPLIIKMRDSITTINDYAFLYTPNRFRNRSATIPVMISAQSITPTEIYYTTTYRQDQNISNQGITATRTDQGTYRFTLTPNTDFATTTTDNITLLIYIDSTLWANKTIEYDTTNLTKMFENDTFEALTDTVVKPIIFILLILIACAVSILTKGEQTGATAFKIGAVSTVLIHTDYWFLTTVIAVGYGLKVVRQFIQND